MSSTAPTGGPPASFSNPWAWCVVVAGLAIYAVLAVVLVHWWVRIEPTMPWAVSLLLPPALYGAVVAVSFRSISWNRWAMATGGLWAAHLALGIITVGLVALGDGQYQHMPGLVFPPPPVPQILWVPLLLIPMRDAVAPRPAPRRAAPAGPRSPSPRPQPSTPSPAVVAAAPSAPARSTTPLTPVAPVPGRETPRSVTPRSATTAPLVERQTSVVVRPAPVPTRDELPDLASPTQRVLERMLAAEQEAATIRIPFERVVGQFPAEMFRTSANDLAAGLREPGQLVIPQRLALAQLEEGVVRVGWDVVADQFPRDLLAMGDEGVRRRLPDAQIVLPLDEVVRQMPTDLFAAELEPVVLNEADDIPDLFLPPSLDEVATVAHAAHASTSRAVDATVRAEADIEEPAARAPIPAPRVPPAGAAATPGMRERVDEERVDEARLPRASEAPAPAADELDPMQRLARQLSPLTPLAAAWQDVTDGSALTLCSPAVDRDLATAVGRTVLSAMTHPQAPRPIDQVTVRGPHLAVVVTALGAVTRGVLVVATPRSGSLALLELVCRRQAGGSALPGGAGVSPADEHGEPIVVEPDDQVRSLETALDSVGPVHASALIDPRGGRTVYLFLPDGSDVRAAGAFTADLAQALDGVNRRGAFDTVIVRGGEHRMVVRLAVSGAGAVVAAVGETRTPGLAHRQVAEIAGAVATT
jgi:hypothetical protein